jgi:hypothetical protein
VKLSGGGSESRCRRSKDDRRIRARLPHYELKTLADKGHEIARLVLAWRRLKRSETVADAAECAKVKARAARVPSLAKREVAAARLTYADAAIALVDANERCGQSAPWRK